MIVFDGERETRYYYHFDGLGSVIALSNENSEIAESYSYDAYGQPTIYNSGYSTTFNYTTKPYLFTGREVDFLDNGSLKIQYNRNRSYDYTTGRWLQRDPIGYYSGTNLYEYVGSNPVYYADPAGLVEVPIPINISDFRICPADLIAPLKEKIFQRIRSRLPEIPSPEAYIRYLHMIRETKDLIKELEAGWEALEWVYPKRYHNNPFMHCVFNCRVFRDVGPEKAREISNYKEQIDNRGADIRDNLLRTGYYKYLPKSLKRKLEAAACSAYQESDKWDNETGRDCGENIECGDWKTDYSCEKCCIDNGIDEDTLEGNQPGSTRPYGNRCKFHYLVDRQTRPNEIFPGIPLE